MENDTDQLTKLFHPLIAKWFSDRFPAPTDIQEQAWPRIAKGEHVLITAPTGSGKTLTAFLWALNQLVTGEWEEGHTSVVYVSPLKALNNDIYRNLLQPLSELRSVFEEAGEAFPKIRALTRSGDTPQSERRQMLRRPPEILITTPESLNLMLSSLGGKSIFHSIKTVILDEIHGVAATKRGVYLMSAVDRLVPLCGDFQRIAISATVKPLAEVAAFVGGYQFNGDPAQPEYTPRKVTILQSRTQKRSDLRVTFPADAEELELADSVWEPVVTQVKGIIEQNKSTLIFTNARALCEKITHLINAGESELIAYSHHGALSREIRATVEAKLKAGELKAIVATNSLEMGIDIGALDEVIMLQSPPSFSSAIQRLGRAGHQVGEISRGKIIPTHSRDFLEAAVLAEGVETRDIEELRLIQSPLDVLAQIIVSMCGTETWNIDALFAWLRASHPFHTLSRQHFDLVLQMLAGRYADSRVRELKPRVSIDAIANTVRARKGALMALYFSGGMIPDRGYFHLRHFESNARIGQLDEEFVWEASIGQVFTLGSQNWRIERITHNDVFVRPGSPKGIGIPFWLGEEMNRDFHFSERIGEFLENADSQCATKEFAESLTEKHCMDATAAGQLIDFLKKQRQESGSALPHRHHLLVEFVSSGPGTGGAPGNQVILHTLWGGMVNRPYAMALNAAWLQRFDQPIEIHAGDDCIAIVLPQEISGDELLSLVNTGNVEELLRKQLENSGFFAARFRECAGRALLLTRNKLNERLPLWLTRLKSEKLLEAVYDYPDFPILLETWRSCLRDEFDMENLHKVLGELETGATTWSEARGHSPSPMARSVAWGQVNEYMYRRDEPLKGRTSSLTSSLLKDLVFGDEVRPKISDDLARRFQEKRQRLTPGYAPDNADDLLDWAKERLLIPRAEWDALLANATRTVGEAELTPDELTRPVADKLVELFPENADGSLICALENLPKLKSRVFNNAGNITCKLLNGKTAKVPARRKSNTGEADGESEMSPDESLIWFLGEWLPYFGPQTPQYLAGTLGIASEPMELAISDLIETRRIIRGELTDGAAEDQICDAENFETLLRWKRAESSVVFEARPAEQLPLFLADWQGLTSKDDSDEALPEIIDQLLALPAPAGAWETDILPARLTRYRQSQLDTLAQENGLQWVGVGEQHVALSLEGDLDLLHPELDQLAPESNKSTPKNAEPDKASEPISSLFPDPDARYDFTALMKHSGQTASKLAERLWTAAWRGEITNDSFAALRKGVQNKFKADLPPQAQTSRQRSRHRPGGRVAMSKWKGSLPFAGNWRRLPDVDLGDDLLEGEERRKERVRLLFDRYGILFRELLLRELPPFRWRHVFRTLRLMELSGEALAGHFFEGLPGPQFISHQAFRRLQQAPPSKAIYWINATDPVSLCGIGLDSFRGPLPKRIASTHIVYRGTEIMMISQRNGASLTIMIEPDDKDLPECLGALSHLLNREFQPVSRIKIETINNEPAAQSPFLDALRLKFSAVSDHKGVTLHR